MTSVAADLTTADLGRLRRYLPPHLADALQAELATPAPRLLEQCLAHLAGLAETTAAYLPADLVAQLARDPVPGRAAGRFLEGTLLFSDISGFTAMSEKLSRTGREGAEEITAVVNRYLDVMLTHLHAHDGQLMKFGGDALLGLFREPASAERAARAALEMQAAMAGLNRRERLAAAERLILKVGLHSGPCLNVTLNDRPDYFGTTVNVAARVQGLSRGGDVVFTAAVHDDPDVRPMLATRPLAASRAGLKGLDGELVVYRLAVLRQAGG